jgi:DNA-binding NtrC family response regulator
MHHEKDRLPMIRVLLYSPDTKLQSLLASALKSEYEVLLESRKDWLKETVRESGAHILVLDFDSNYSSLEQQLEFYNQLGELHIPTVVMTDDMRRSTATEFMRRGAHDCVRKPPSLVEFRVIVGRAYEHALMKKELETIRLTMSLTHGYDKLVGSSGRAQVVYDLIHRLANLNAFVLITGESGTGKELVARALHNQGNRAKHPFIAVSCGAIPESLIEAELFGHERGAFTGSTGSRAGFLEQAGEGTILLDEIGELSLNTQVKLLRVLQQKEFSRLGSNKLIPLNARVLFATHRNLQQMVEAGTFRRDLYYRVNVMNISVPPLRERTEDIPLLARHFLRQYAADFGKEIHDIRPSAMEALVEYEWPGNIRELENIIQSATILADDNCITRNDLPDFLQQLTDEEGAEPASSDSEGFETLLRQYKVNLANKVILECNGNKSLAAKKLQVSRAYLHRLIRLPAGELSALPATNVTPFRQASWGT